VSKFHNKPDVPEPAHPRRRREPLPWQSPKPLRDDPECPGKLKAILDSPSYVLAVKDVDFLGSGDARGVRLQLDYLKPERGLTQHALQRTIIVFGSTRIVEPAAAKDKVARLRDALLAKPNDSVT
jgi:hypothetical protein